MLRDLPADDASEQLPVRHLPSRLFPVSLIATLLDLLIFVALRSRNVDVVAAHVYGFAAATLFGAVYLARMRSSDEPDAVRPGSVIWPSFALVQVLALAIRGGVFAALFFSLQLSPAIAIVPAILAGAAISYCGQAWIIWQRPFATEGPTMLVAGAIASLVVLRLLFLGQIDLLPEEAYYWNYSRHLDIGYLDHPPMVAWIIWIGTWLFGTNEFGVRVGAFFAWLATAIFAALLTRNLFGNRAALISCLLISVMPFYFLSGFLMLPDAPLTAAWAGTLFFLERALIGNKRAAWLGAGLCFGLGMLSKYTIALLGPAALLFMLLDPRARRWLMRPEPYVAALIATALFSPVIYWNATHDWMSFAFQGSRRLEEAHHFSLPVLIGYAAIVLTPTGLLAALILIASSTVTVFSPARFRDSKLLFSVVFTLVPLSVFVAFSLFHENKPNWTGPLWLAILPVLADRFIGQAGKETWIARRLKAAGPLTIGITIAVFALMFHYIALGFPGVGHRHNIRTLPIAWDEFGDAVADIEKTVESQSDKPVVLVGMDQYFVASEMAFYVRPGGIHAPNSIGRGAVGGGGLMYDIWFPADRSNGNTALMISLGKGELERKDLADRFSQMTDIREQVVEKRGVAIGKFYYRIGYDLRSCASTATSCGPSEID
ncbi:MAG: glycosyltransferase family 39 protein [Rhizobiaceae bacterium]|nr:glycosyltransferase family 39 protein [Rhizobiaceae bacterium]